jgi:hypothetical protein
LEKRRTVPTNWRREGLCQPIGEEEDCANQLEKRRIVLTDEKEILQFTPFF